MKKSINKISDYFISIKPGDKVYTIDWFRGRKIYTSVSKKLDCPICHGKPIYKHYDFYFEKILCPECKNKKTYNEIYINYVPLISSVKIHDVCFTKFGIRYSYRGHKNYRSGDGSYKYIRNSNVFLTKKSAIETAKKRAKHKFVKPVYEKMIKLIK